MYFFNSWLKVNQACLPDEINWENIGYSTCSRRIRKCMIWIVAALLILIGLIGVVLLRLKSENLKEEFQT